MRLSRMASDSFTVTIETRISVTKNTIAIAAIMRIVSLAM